MLTQFLLALRALRQHHANELQHQRCTREQPSGMGTCTVERFLFTLNTVLCMRHKTQSQNSTKPTSATHIEESVSLDFTAISVNDLCVCVCCMSIALRALFV